MYYREDLDYVYSNIISLKKAIFKFSYKHNKPIIPMSISFRPRKSLWELFGKKPYVDLHTGEQLFLNKSLLI